MNRRNIPQAPTANPPQAGAPLSAFARQHIDALGAQCGAWLHVPIDRGLSEFGQRLLDRADKASNHYDQEQYLTTHKRLECMRDDFDRHFVASIDRAFQQLGSVQETRSEATKLSLGLLDTHAHERNAALDQLVTRCVARGAMQMVNLGYRFGVLLATPPLDSAQLPLGPQAMARAFREACSMLDIPTAHEILLLQSLESSLIDKLTALYELADDYLSDAGILPGLRPYVLPRQKRRGEARQHDPAEAVRQPVASTAAPAGETRATATSSAQDGVTTARLQAALRALQEHLLEADDQTRYAMNQPQRLREEMALLLNVGHDAEGSRLGLSAAQTRTVDLIVRLFEEVAQKLPNNTDTHALLFDLQVPVLRLALADPAFFQDAGHPARQVLNTIADTAREWLDEAGGTPDHELRMALEQLIDDACRSTPSTAVFVTLGENIESCLQRWQQARCDAEEQQADAMRGLERLEQARLRTSTLLAARGASAQLMAEPAVPLHHAWSDVLALTLIRHGEDSTQFSERLDMVEPLLGLRPVVQMDAFRRDIDEGLRHIGIAVEEREAMIDAWLRNLPGAASAEGRSAVPSTRTGDQATPEILGIHRQLRNLPAGTWFEFLGPSGTPPIRRRLAWYSTLTGHALFVTRNGQRAQELGELRLARAIASGHVRLAVERGGDVVEQALQIASRGADPMSGPAQHGAAS
jgi:hypothetical protein